jgi:hypothetical protein
MLYESVHPDTFNKVMDTFNPYQKGSFLERNKPSQAGSALGEKPGYLPNLSIEGGRSPLYSAEWEVPFKQFGGAVAPYRVGEDGPELYQPDNPNLPGFPVGVGGPHGFNPPAPGRIIPNPQTEGRQLGGGVLPDYSWASEGGGEEPHDYRPMHEYYAKHPQGAQHKRTSDFGFGSTMGGFSPGVQATAKKNLIGDIGGPLSPIATQQYKEMGIPLPGASMGVTTPPKPMQYGGPAYPNPMGPMNVPMQVAAPKSEMGNLGDIDVSNIGMGGMEYRPDFSPARAGQRIGSYPTPMGPMGGLRYAGQYTPRPMMYGGHIDQLPMQEGGMVTPDPWGRSPEQIGAGGRAPGVEFLGRQLESMRKSPPGSAYALPGPEAPIDMVRSPEGIYVPPAPRRREEFSALPELPGGAAEPLRGDWREPYPGVRYTDRPGKTANQLPKTASFMPGEWGMPLNIQTPEQVELAARQNFPQARRDLMAEHPGALGVTPGWDIGYYGAHPEERAMEAARAYTQPTMDAYQKALDHYMNTVGGFGMIGMGRRGRAQAQAEAARAIPGLTAGMERLAGMGPETYGKALEYGPTSPRAELERAQAEHLRELPGLEKWKISEQSQTHLEGIREEIKGHLQAAEIAAGIKDPLQKAIDTALNQAAKYAEMTNQDPSAIDEAAIVGKLLRVQHDLGKISDEQWKKLPRKYKAPVAGARLAPDGNWYMPNMDPNTRKTHPYIKLSGEGIE